MKTYPRQFKQQGLRTRRLRGWLAAALAVGSLHAADAAVASRVQTKTRAAAVTGNGKSVTATTQASATVAETTGARKTARKTRPTKQGSAAKLVTGKSAATTALRSLAIESWNEVEESNGAVTVAVAQAAQLAAAQALARASLISRFLRDPYAIALTGFGRDEVVSLQVQEPSAAIGIVPVYGKLGGQALRTAMVDALRFKEFKSLDMAEFDTIEGEGGALLSKKIIPEELAIHAPVRAVGSMPGGGKGRSSAIVNVSPRIDQAGVNTAGGRISGFRIGGTVQSHYQPWINAANIFVAPAFAGGGAKSKARFTALAAFPIGAEVTILNLRTMAKVQGKASMVSGSLDGDLPDAAPGTRYKISVTFPGQAGASNETTISSTFMLPQATPKRPAYKAIDVEGSPQAE